MRLVVLPISYDTIVFGQMYHLYVEDLLRELVFLPSALVTTEDVSCVDPLSDIIEVRVVAVRDDRLRASFKGS